MVMFCNGVVMTNVLLSAARALVSPFRLSPKHPARIFMRASRRLGAAKQEKRARRGRTGQNAGMHAGADGNAAFRFRNEHALGHGPVAVPPANAKSLSTRLTSGKAC
jgi:hypothetical protein